MASAVVIGVGPEAGLGAALARRFAREGLDVLVAGRSQDKLDAVVAAIRAEGGTAGAAVLDASDEPAVTALFAGLAPELVVFNVGGNLARPALDIDGATFERLWRQNALAGFLVGREAVRALLPQGRGTLLFTGATASLKARPPFTAFASAKAALRAVAQGLAREFGPQGIHVAHVVIDGVIGGDYARDNFPDFVRHKGEDGLLALDDIADAYWALHRQRPSAWTHELDLRPFKEGF
ncbi:SDR family NAD(P)-dependent oxidoreductase [Derxia lacustris]|uniref:SDR family NAD(P)-dependent oxidoreductase n=1 Tax=Derxia lacustris TaxID=764842 RepID=UPI000A175143|nr:SDR family NAD(P)-dependent oxidoreductase [Derxia lacustris]